MIEGQNGLTWERWKRMVRAVDSLGFVGLFRSDHFTNADPPDRDSLDLWISLAWLADQTERIEFGPLVTPLSFRHPVHTARMARDVDDLSGGRLVLGLGAGWQEREHEKFGWDLLSVSERMDRLEEGLVVISQLMRRGEPVDFEGNYYHLQDAALLPPSQRPGGPPILVGGNGMQRTLPLAAAYADEWNGVYLTPGAFSRRNERLDELLDEEGRDPESLRRSLMTGCVYGDTPAGLERQARGWNGTVDEIRDLGIIVGTGSEIVDQLGVLAEAGAQRVMLQWLDLDALDRLEALAAEVLPQV
jgi:F420-dependent oxidoreductase-like protein